VIAPSQGQASLKLTARIEASGPNGTVSVGLKLCGDLEDMLRGSVLCLRVGMPELLQWELQLNDSSIQAVSVHIEVPISLFGACSTLA